MPCEVSINALCRYHIVSTLKKKTYASKPKHPCATLPPYSTHDTSSTTMIRDRGACGWLLNDLVFERWTISTMCRHHMSTLQVENKRWLWNSGCCDKASIIACSLSLGTSAHHTIKLRFANHCEHWCSRFRPARASTSCTVGTRNKSVSPKHQWFHGKRARDASVSIARSSHLCFLSNASENNSPTQCPNLFPMGLHQVAGRSSNRIWSSSRAFANRVFIITPIVTKFGVFNNCSPPCVQVAHHWVPTQSGSQGKEWPRERPAGPGRVPPDRLLHPACWPGHQHCEGFSPDLPYFHRQQRGLLGDAGWDPIAADSRSSEQVFSRKEPKSQNIAKDPSGDVAHSLKKVGG